MKKVIPKGVLWSSIFGFCGTILFYFLESNGLLNAVEPQWLLESNLGYILWGMAAAVVGYGCGIFFNHGQTRTNTD
jgi:ABC-type polysaccharide/polyol phosphate export permease